MERTHAQQFANHTLPRAVFADALAVMRSLRGDDGDGALAGLWERAGEDLAPIARVHGARLATTVARRGLYTVAIVAPPAPREAGDPALLAIIGRGDGIARLTTVSYYVLELRGDAATGAPRFQVVSRGGADARGTSYGEGPLPDPRWLAEHVFELYAGRTPAPGDGVPALPGWYWWHALHGASALRAFCEVSLDVERLAAIRSHPILLLPEIADTAELVVGPASVARLRELRAAVVRDPSHATTWRALVDRMTSSSPGALAASALRALPLIAEAAGQGALDAAQANALEAVVRSKLASTGVDPETNYALAEQLFERAREVERAPRLARGSVPPAIPSEDPVWRPLFLEESDLPRSARADFDETFGSIDPAFVGCGGVRAGYVAWARDDLSALARVVDARWVFRSATAAAYFLRAHAATLGDGLPAVHPPPLGDEAMAYGGELWTEAGARRTQVVVVRVGRVVARLQALEGARAAAARDILHAASLHPLVHKIVVRARQAIAAYWLAVAAPSNAVPALVHSPGHDAARLLDRYPLLAHAELPAAMATLGDAYAPVARALASVQAQVRAHRWGAYRAAMLGLARALLDAEVGDPRVNVAHAHDVVTELRVLDPDPIWLQLDAECRARG